MKWGLEISSLGIADIENHTAMHYHASRTEFIKGEDNLLTYYAKLICEQAEDLQKLSKVMNFDAFSRNLALLTVFVVQDLRS